MKKSEFKQLIRDVLSEMKEGENVDRVQDDYKREKEQMSDEHERDLERAKQRDKIKRKINTSNR